MSDETTVATGPATGGQSGVERDHLAALAGRDVLPEAHRRYLWRLRDELGFEPKVVYDIGACVLHWTRHARQVWPGAEVVLFDAFAPAAFLYDGHRHHVGVLSDADGRDVDFFQNVADPGGNSYYREIGHPMSDRIFPRDSAQKRSARALDSVVAERGFPMPDLIKIDVQGAEQDVLRGAIGVMAHAKVLIVEMQDTHYNDGAPLAAETLPFVESLGWTCVARKFCDNGPDADYAFVRNGVDLRAPC